MREKCNELCSLVLAVFHQLALFLVSFDRVIVVKRVVILDPVFVKMSKTNISNGETHCECGECLHEQNVQRHTKTLIHGHVISRTRPIKEIIQCRGSIQ